MREKPLKSRASVLTPAGRGAVAVVVAEGKAALAAIDQHFRAANGRPLSSQAIGRILFGQWREGRDHAEEIVVCRINSLQTEVHCHGGVAASGRLLAALEECGCAIEAWPHWVRRHAANAIEAE